MFAYDRCFEAAIRRVQEEGRYRTFIDIARQRERFPIATHFAESGRREVTVWCSNDYLGMGQHPEVIRAIHAAVDQCGAGSGGTRNISGTNHYHVELERELASLHGKERALLFTSGYVANWTALGVLGAQLPGCVILSDEKNHASMIEGIRRSGAQKRIFRHNDLGDLRRQLAECPPGAPKLIVFESVYSMDADIAPIAEICDAAAEFDALTYLDEVHAVGLYGDHGGGVAERDGCADRVTVIQGTLAKGFGIVGGYIAGPAGLVDCVRTFGSGFIFSTSLPPMVSAGALASIRHLRRSGAERARHRERVARVREGLRNAQIRIKDTESHIILVMINDARRCKAVADRLLHEHGIYIQPINYPTVPRGSECLRITPSPVHTDTQIDELVDALREALAEDGHADERRARNPTGVHAV